MKAEDLYIVIPSYAPNTATMNRIMAFIRGFSEQGLKTHVSFLVSDSYESKFQDIIPNVDFSYMWEGLAIRNRILLQFQLELNSRKYVAGLPKNATIFLPWPSTRLMSLLVKRKDLRVYYEETELPELYKMKLFNLKDYFASIQKLKGLFVISSSLKEYFLGHNVTPQKIQIINMIVDTSRFDGILKINASERYIAYCGTVTNNKDGVDTLIKAFAIVHKKHPDVKLYVIGNIPHAKEESMIFQLVNSLGLLDAVCFTGIIPYDGMPQILKNAEVLALARPDNIQAKFGFPTKLGEYLLTGNPVVLTSVGDIPLFLKDGESALLSKPNDIQAFAEKLNWTLENREKALKIGEKGKAMADEYFNYKKESKKIIDFIQD